jgi:hypothetical protein
MFIKIKNNRPEGRLFSLQSIAILASLLSFKVRFPHTLFVLALFFDD